MIDEKHVREMLKAKFGPGVTFYHKTWPLPKAERYVTLFYAEKAGVIIGIANSLPDLLK